jgi:hypothetical protein
MQLTHQLAKILRVQQSMAPGISIDPVFLVINECIAITSSMRKNARWAQSGVASILAAPDLENDEQPRTSRRKSKNNSNSGLVCSTRLWMDG